MASAMLAGVATWYAWMAANARAPTDRTAAIALAGIALLGVVQAAGLAWLVYTTIVARNHLAAIAARRADDPLQRNDRQHRRVVDQIEQVIFQLDAKGRWTFLNKAWQVLTGETAEGSIGQMFDGFLHPDDRAEAHAAWADLRAHRKDESHHELRFLTREGSIRWTAVDARAMVEDGVFVGVTGTITDVTARRHAQQELEGARIAAERASAAKSEFLKSMSHEMRTPLNGVLGLMELLLATRLDAQQARYVAVARASATHLANLITDILDLARIEDGALVLDRVLFDLPDLIESSLDVVGAEASRKRLRLSCTVTEDLPTWVLGDPGRLRQVLVNLLGNAVKFTERGEVHVHAGAVVDLHARTALVRIEVHDTGIGMTPEQVDRLFLPFTPGDASNTRRHSGTGLGLTICKRLLDAMEGTIDARSEASAGATFTVTLPIEVADAARVETERQGDAPLRVLAVLSDPADRAEIGRLLEGWRFDAAVVTDCDTGLAFVEHATPARQGFGVVLLDGLVPGAAAFAGRLRDVSPPPGVVWITPEDGRVPVDISGVREQIGHPVKGPALFDAIMQAVVGSTADTADQSRPPAWPRRLRVLVAEDHEVNQMVVRDLLRSMDLDVDVVSDGEAACAAVLSTPYDVVLMDCRMPVLDGLEATRRIREAHADRPIAQRPWIIALTANATAEDRQACLAAGMDAYLTKPVRGTVLQRTLQRLVLGEAGADDEQEDAPSATPAVSPAPRHEPMRAEVPDAEDILDPADVLLRCNHNADLGAQMLQLFAESLPDELEALEAAAATNDRDALGRIAHKMRGAAATLAAVRLAGAITGIELFLKYGDGGPLPQLVAEVRHESALFLGVVPQIVRRLTDGTAASRQG